MISIIDEQKQQARFIKMTQSPVKKLIIEMSIPTIISMLVTTTYNIVDSLFVGHISTEAVASVGISFAYMSFINACGYFFGHGSGNYISRMLGSKNPEAAERMASIGFFSPIIFGILASIVGLIYIDDLALFMGATELTISYTEDYLFYLFIATPFMMSALTLNNQLRLQGNTMWAMVGIASGVVVNIFLDYFFIFVVDMGVAGASLSTAIGQFVSWLVLLNITYRKGNVHIRLRDFKPTLSDYREIISGGFPSLARQIFYVIATIVVNQLAIKYSDIVDEASVVAALAIVNRAMWFCFAIVLGLGQGFQPVCGYNYGAKLYKRVLESYRFCIILSFFVLLVLGGIGYVFAPDIIGFFRSKDPLLIDIGVKAMRWQCVVFPLMGFYTMTNMLLQNIGSTGSASLLSISRQGLFFIPVVIILANLFGIDGLCAAQGISDLFTFLLSIPFAINIIRKLKLLSYSNNCDLIK